jgi:transposase
VDTQGLPLEVVVTSANVSDTASDTAGAHRRWKRLGRRRGVTKKLRKVWGDSGYKKGIQDKCAYRYGVTREVVSAPPEQKGFAVQPRRWVVERSFGWISSHRRLGRDYQVLPLHSENMIWCAFLRLVLRRLA